MSAKTASEPKTYNLPKASAARLKALLDQVNMVGAAYRQELGAAFAWLSIPEDIDLRRVAIDFDKATLTVKPEQSADLQAGAPERASGDA